MKKLLALSLLALSLGFSASLPSGAPEQNGMSAERLNRIDGVMVFHALTKEHIRSIVDLMLGMVNKQLAERNMKIEVTDAAKDFLGEKGYDEVFGARPLRRVIQEMVEDKLSDSLLRGHFREGDTIVVDLEGTEIVLHPHAVAALAGNA